MSSVLKSEKLILCEVYKNGRNDETFLFVDREERFERVPDELKSKFESPILVTQFKLTPERKMARSDAQAVMKSIQEKGYYIQMPPPKDIQLAAMSAKNEKLQR